MKRFLRQLFPLLTSLFIAIVIGQGVEAQLLINTVAGQTGVSGTDGDGGPATLAHLFSSGGVAGTLAADKRGNFYLIDYTAVGGSYIIRKVDGRGIITRYAGVGTSTAPKGSGDGGPAIAAELGTVPWISADSAGDLFLLMTATNYSAIRKIDAQTGIITTLTSTDGAQPFAPGTLAKNARFASDKPFVADAKGNLYVINKEVSPAIFFKIDPAGTISTYSDLTAQVDEYGSPVDLIDYMNDLAIDKKGNLYFPDTYNYSCVFKATPGGIYSRVAGTLYGYAYSGDGGLATDAAMFSPNAVCIDTADNLLISDGFNFVIRKVDAVSGIINTIAGDPNAAGLGDGGPAINASLGQVSSIRTNTDGNILVFAGTYTVRMLAERLVKFTFDTIPAKTYGDADFTLNAYSSNGSVPSFRSNATSVVSVTADGKAHITGAGTVILTADFPALGTDTADQRSVTLIVAKKGLTVTADNETISEGNPIPSLTFRYSGFVNGDDSTKLTTLPAATTTATSASPIGNYPITVSGGVSGNYSFSYVSGTLFIAQPVLLPQTITFGTLTDKTYGDADFAAGATSDNATIPIVLKSSNTSVATIVDGTIHVVGAGTVTLTASQPADAFYSAAQDVPQSFTVNKAVLSVTADNKTKAYGAALPALTLSYSGWKNGEGLPALTTAPQPGVTATAASPAGDYPITISPGVANNYEFDYHPGVLTITALAQTISFGKLPVKNYTDGDFPTGATSTNTTIPLTYNSSDPTVATVTASGFIHITGTGVVTITVSQAGSGDFAAAPDVSQPLTVGPAPLVITPDDKTRVQGQANPVFTFNYAGFKEGETPDQLIKQPVATTPANTDSYPGVYLITASGAQASSHYNISYLPGALTVVIDSTKNADRLDAWCSSPSTLEVNINALANQKAVIDLYNLNGKRMLSMPVYLINATNTIQVPVGNISAGLYIVQVTGQYLRLTQKISIVR